MEEYSSEELEAVWTSHTLKDDIESIHHKAVAGVQVEVQNRVERCREQLEDWSQRLAESGQDQNLILHELILANSGTEMIIGKMRVQCRITIGHLEELMKYRLDNSSGRV